MAAPRAFIAALCLLAFAPAASAVGLLRRHVGESFIRSLEFKQKLRVCNAYPYGAALDVYVAQTKLTEIPLAYKSCGEFSPKLQVGDEVDFKVQDTSAGTFTISDLPSNDAVLLMVIYRHDTLSTAVSFESHVFASLSSAQIAVMDTYKGQRMSELRIQDAGAAGASAGKRSELLRFNNVVAVDPGIYEVTLQDAGSNATQARSSLVALSKEAYVIVRCGVEAQTGTAYPEELLVFPHSDQKALGAAKPTRPAPAGALGALLAAAILGAARFGV